MAYGLSRTPSARLRVPCGLASFPQRARQGLVAALAAVAIFGIACEMGGFARFGQGRVGVALTDRSSGDFVSVHMTVSGIELLGSAGSAPVFDGLETFDPLRLRDASELFSMADGVPAGRYEGVRIFVEEIEVTRHSEDGGLQVVPVVLPEGRKMDLLAPPGIDVAAGETLVVEIDLDLSKSLVPGEADRLELRPVSLVKVLSDGLPGRLARIHGKATKVDAQASTLQVCRTHFALSPRQDRFVDHEPAQRCVDVVVDDSAALLDAKGDPGSLGGIPLESEVTVFGRFRLSESQDEGRPLSLHAGRVLIGVALEDGTRFAVQLQAGTQHDGCPGSYCR